MVTLFYMDEDGEVRGRDIGHLGYDIMYLRFVVDGNLIDIVARDGAIVADAKDGSLLIEPLASNQARLRVKGDFDQP